VKNESERNHNWQLAFFTPLALKGAPRAPPPPPPPLDRQKRRRRDAAVPVLILRSSPEGGGGPLYPAAARAGAAGAYCKVQERKAPQGCPEALRRRRRRSRAAAAQEKAEAAKARCFFLRGLQAPPPASAAQDPQARVPALGDDQDEPGKGKYGSERERERERVFFFPCSVRANFGAKKL